MNLMNKNILVTGGCGAVGSNLVGRLINMGCKSVTVIDNLTSGLVENLPTSSNLTFIEGDITLPKDLDRAFQKDIDVVFHLAARFANQNSVENPIEDLNTNIKGTLLLLEYSRRKYVKFIYTSSSCVYGNKKGELNESDIHYLLDTPYAISKLTGEYYTKFYQDFYGLNTVVLRLFNSYGPNERDGKYRNVIPNFIARALRQEPLIITGTGDETRDFTFVGDVVDALTAAAEKEEATGSVFNIGSGKETRIIELANIINELTGNKAGIQFAPRRPWDKITRRAAGIAKAKAILGYSPKVQLEEGIRETINWFKVINVGAK